MKALTEVYEEIVQILYHEAELLDTGQFTRWLEMMTDDFTYRVPIRLTRERGEMPTFSDIIGHFQEDLPSLRLRIDRLKTEFAWAEDPPSRTRHFITNVRCSEGPTSNEVSVRSNLLVWRSRGDDPHSDLLSGERHDVWRHVGGHWKVARRVIYLDQATLGTKNLSIFL